MEMERTGIPMQTGIEVIETVFPRFNFFQVLSPSAKQCNFGDPLQTRRNAVAKDGSRAVCGGGRGLRV